MVVIRESVNQGFLIHFLFGTMILVGLKGQVSVLFCVDSREEQNASSILVIERYQSRTSESIYVKENNPSKQTAHRLVDKSRLTYVH